MFPSKELRISTLMMGGNDSDVILTHTSLQMEKSAALFGVFCLSVNLQFPALFEKLGNFEFY